MPFVIPAIAAGAIAGTAAATAAAVGGAFTLGFSFSAFAISAVIGGLSMALAKKPSSPGDSGGGGSSFDAQGRNLSVTQPVSPWQLVMGEVRVGGTQTFAYLDSSKTYYHEVITLACHPCAGLAEVILNGDLITPNMIDVDGHVIAGNWGGYGYAPRAAQGAVPASPFQVTLSLIAGGALDSVELVSLAVETFGEEGVPTFAQARLTDVSPASPATFYEYSRSGLVFTFHSSTEGLDYTINWTERAPSNQVLIQFASGAETGQPFPGLVAQSEGRWTDAHRQTGHCKVWVRYLVDRILLSGKPNVTVVLRGAMPYDPRSGLSAYTHNPALLLADYLTNDEYGFGADFTTDISSADLQAAANICEERVRVAEASVLFSADYGTGRLTLTGPATGEAVLELNASSGVPVRTPRTGDGVRLAAGIALPTGYLPDTTYYVIRYSAGIVALAATYAQALAGTAVGIGDAGSGNLVMTPWDEPRYTANGTFLTSQGRSDLLNGLLGTMGAGRCLEIGGTWRISAGAYEAPTVTLDESELAGPIHIDPVTATADAANGIRGVFMDTANLFTPTDFPAVTDAAYVAADGGEEIWQTLDFTQLVTSSATTQRLAKIELRRRRFAMTVTAPFQLSAYRALTARTVSFDMAKYGWTGGAQEFEVVDTKFVKRDGEGDNAAPALGVDLVLRQTASELWDWDMSEQELMKAVTNTRLPSPFDITAPGVPTVTEDLYQTSGSAGVKSRAILAWMSGDTAPVHHYRARYKRVEDAAYTVLPVIPPGLSGEGGAQVDDLSAGLYLFGVQAVNVFGVESAWVTVVKELVGLTAAPGAMTGAALSSLAAQQAELTWDKSTDLDVRIGGRVLWRWTPLTSGATWNDGIEVANVPGDSTSCRVSHQSGTYLGKFRDSTGNESAASNNVVTTTPDLAGYNAVATLTEHSAFTGAKSSTLVIDGKLTLDAGTLIDALGLIDDLGFIDTAGGVAASGTYDFSSVVDLGIVYTSRVTAALKTLSVDTGDNIDQRLDPIDLWGLVDGPQISDVNAQLYVATTADDPAGAPTWSAWRPFVIGDYLARGLKFRLVLTSTNLNHNIQVLELAVTIDMPDRADSADDVASGTGTYAVAFAIAPAFKVAPNVQITAQNMATGDYYAITGKTATGFDIAFKNAAGVGVNRTFDWAAQGY